ncbi:MAG TPA: lytic transglycosylase domain-containing protein [Spirochaetota bacterium]|nr:lytic transglycosylase domain-containing protein [Spirochaetota bacterium]HPU89697.1 lytic transglycosylase domain-containing protein [Spirochaetota bacterium]
MIRIRQLSLVFILSLVSCLGPSPHDASLAALGLYRTPEEVVERLKGDPKSYREHFMLGMAYKKLKKYKTSIHHFANSCFAYSQNKNLKIFARPVYRYVDEIHIKTEFYDDAVFHIADQFYLYREYEHVVTFIDLMKKRPTALYRDAVMLKSRALLELSRPQAAIDVLADLERLYEDPISKAAIAIRRASVHEKMNQPERAVQAYLAAIAVDERGWHATIAVNQLATLTKNFTYQYRDAELLSLGKAFHHNGKYDAAAGLITALRERKPADTLSHQANASMIRTLVRLRRFADADAIVRSYEGDPERKRAMLKEKADELWEMRLRREAADAYEALAAGHDDDLAQEALNRVCRNAEKSKRAGWEAALRRFVERFPKNASSEYLLWLLARDELKKRNYAQAREHLAKANNLFPAGQFSDRIRFWLFKLYALDRKNDEALRFARELVSRNPGSPYAWILLERHSKDHTASGLSAAFDAARAKGDRDGAAYYHGLLYFKERDRDRRDRRAEQFFSAFDNPAAEFEKHVSSMSLASKYAGALRDCERYFQTGAMEALNRELDLLPADERTRRDRYTALSHFGAKYGNWYLMVSATLELMKLTGASENIMLFSRAAVDRLMPLAYVDCIDSAAKRFRVDRLLLAAIIRSESLFNHAAVSSAGATGLMQLMPQTARGLARELRLARYDLKDPCTSVDLGARYLQWLAANFRNNIDDMMGAYNAGPGMINKWRASLRADDGDFYVELIPFQETRFYILRSRKHLLQYQVLYGAR